MSPDKNPADNELTDGEDYHAREEPPPILKSWNNLYLVVLGNLLLWIALFTLFTWMFK
jgi:hypothetical protein